MIYYNAVKIENGNLWYEYFEDRQACEEFIAKHPEYHMTPKVKSYVDFSHTISEDLAD